MSPFTLVERTVQLIERDDREREELEQLLESLDLQFEVFSSLAVRSPGSGGCLLWSVDGLGPHWDELDDVLAEIGEGTSVVVLGRAPPLAVVIRALKAGAVDVLCKPLGPEELRRAVQESFARNDAERLRRAGMLELRKRLDRLTPRERSVFQRLVAGRLNKQVGAELGISERTVKAHRASILRKVAVGSVAELVRVATTFEFGCQKEVERAAVASRQALGPPEVARSLQA